MVSNLSYFPPLGNSDHICIQFDLMCYSEPKKTVNYMYNTRAANIDIMKQTLCDVDWVIILDPLDMNDAWLRFKSIYFKILLTSVFLLLKTQGKDKSV